MKKRRFPWLKVGKFKFGNILREKPKECDWYVNVYMGRPSMIYDQLGCFAGNKDEAERIIRIQILEFLVEEINNE